MCKMCKWQNSKTLAQRSYQNTKGDKQMNYFENELNYITDEEVRNKCKEVLANVNEQFFEAAASSTGKYHPDYALGEGGLYRHTVAAVMIAADLRRNECVANFDDKQFSYIIAALILHDSCKSGIDWDSKYTKHNHPLLVKELLDDVLGECEFTEEVGRLVASHMGQWTTCKWDKTVLPRPQLPDEIFVHLCDYLASRKFIEINFEKGI